MSPEPKAFQPLLLPGLWFVLEIRSCSLGAEEIYFGQYAQGHEEESLQPSVSAQLRRTDKIRSIERLESE